MFIAALLRGLPLKETGIDLTTAKKWHKDFILTIADHLGFLD